VSPEVGPVAPAPLQENLTFVDSVQGGGSAASVSATGLEADGEDRYVFAMVGAGTGVSVDDIDCTIAGSSGIVPMSRVFLSGTQHADPENSLEAFAGFVIDEANLPGDGPYDLTASASGAGIPNKIGIVAGSVINAPSAPTVVIERASSVTEGVGTDGSLVIAGLGSNIATSNASMTGATQVENLMSYGDGIQLGWTMADTGSGRTVSALVIFSPA